MDLFDSLNPQPTSRLLNHLPQDGCVHYYGPIMSVINANIYFAKLRDNIQWKQDEAIIFGNRITTRRKVAWYGDLPFSYSYSNTRKQALSWIPELLALKSIVEKTTNETFNSCLLNLYHDGNDGVGWHSDGEKELKKQGAIGSLSLGATRNFSFKHKVTQEKVSLVLEHGSLLVMKGATQNHWLHQLPKSKKITDARINLTFRTINYENFSAPQ